MSRNSRKEQISSELFRFVTIRPPRITSRSNTATIHYLDDEYSSEQERTFPQLCALKELSGMERYKEVNEILDNYAGTNAFILSEQGLTNDYVGFDSFYQWAVSVNTETPSVVRAKLKTLTGSSDVDLVNDLAAQVRIWDNYFYYVHKQNNGLLLQSLTNTLRVYAIAKRLVGLKSESINAIEQATVVLPECIADMLLQHPLVGYPPPVNTDPANDQINNIEEAVDYNEESRRLNLAITNLSDALAEFLTSKEGSGPMEQMVTGKTISVGEIFDLLNDESKKQLKSQKKLMVNEAIEFLQDQLITNRKNQLSQLQTTERYVMLGATMKRSPKPPLGGGSSGSTPNPGMPGISVQELLNEMYNDWWKKQDPNQLIDIMVGDFKRVEQETDYYEAGEVAHIENILAGEKKSHDTRRLTRSEQTTTTETSYEEESERDVQTTSRFEMEKEVSSVIASDTSIEAGMNMTANYGTVQISANAGFSTNISTENANRQATNYAKSVTERARNRIVTKTVEKKTAVLIKEFEDKNLHLIDNTGLDTAGNLITDPQGNLVGRQNIVGIYRWVDKVYKNTLVNYGKRMMLKINLAEPAAFFKFAQSKNEERAVDFPVSPEGVADQNPGLDPLTSFKSITPENYHIWAAIYDAAVDPPPTMQTHVGTSIAVKKTGSPHEQRKPNNERINEYESEKIDTLVIPAGYEPEKVFVRTLLELDTNRNTEGPQSLIWIGNMVFYTDPMNSAATGSNPSHPQWANGALQTMEVSDNLDAYKFVQNRSTNIPVVTYTKNAYQFVSNIIVRCKPTDASIDSWRRDTYDAIIEAYRTKLQEAEYAKSQLMAQTGVEIKGRNPLTNQHTIKTELKKGCINAIRVYNLPWGQSSVENKPSPMWNYPTGEPYVINPLMQQAEGKLISFVEECCEWNQMTYTFHPYYWARKEEWTDIMNIRDNDPLFEYFLTAGNAQIVVPVTPGYEKHFAYYLKTGQLWKHGDPPIADKLSAFIEEELSEAGNIEPETEDCWKTKLPTNLVILQKQDGGLDETGLPDFDLPECE